MHCPLCNSANISFFHKDKHREYLHCEHCDLVFVEPIYRPSVELEKNEYSLHQNSDDDLGYLTFLDRARQPLLETVSPPARGLDYGCGPNPVLAKLLVNDGYEMDWYDPIFFDRLQEGKYDFIVCTEAIEHFHQPINEWQKWLTLLTDKGHLIIMTKRWLSKERFTNWHYKNDKTHVSFFHLNTFEYLANEYGFNLNVSSNDVVVMQRV